jgi:hypothetical protein
MIYLISAYVVAVVVLGGFLWLSLGTLRDLDRKISAKK